MFSQNLCQIVLATNIYPNYAMHQRCPNSSDARSTYIHTWYPTCMLTISLYFVLFLWWLCYLWWWIRVIHLPIFFRISSQAPGQSYDCPGACEVTLKNMGKTKRYQSTTKHHKARTMCIILEMYSTWPAFRSPLFPPMPLPGQQQAQCWLQNQMLFE